MTDYQLHIKDLVYHLGENKYQGKTFRITDSDDDIENNTTVWQNTQIGIIMNRNGDGIIYGFGDSIYRGHKTEFIVSGYFNDFCKHVQLVKINFNKVARNQVNPTRVNYILEFCRDEIVLTSIDGRVHGSIKKI